MRYDSLTHGGATRANSIQSHYRWLTISVFNGSFYTINKMSRFMHIPADEHWHGIQHILQYLSGTMTTWILLLVNNTHSLHAFTYAFSSWIHIRRLGRESRQLHFDGGIYLLLWKATNSLVFEETYNLCSLIYKGCVPVYCFHNNISVLAYFVAHWVSHCHQHQKYTAKT